MRQSLVRSTLKFARDRDGSLALNFGLLVVPLFAFTGIAIDYSQALNAKGKLQQIADTAAIAGARLPATSSEKRYEASMAMLKASLNNSGLKNLTWDVDASNANVSVHVNHVMKTNFMRVMGVESLDIEVATAAQAQVENGGVACLIALNEHTPDGLHLQGINKVSSRNCWTWVNSDHATSINAVGASMGTGQGFCTHGRATGAEHFVPQPYEECDIMADPFYDRFYSYHPVAMNAPCNYTNLDFKNGSYTMTPGVYCGNTILKPQANVTMLPGTYVFKNGFLEVQAQASLTGSDGVTLFFMGSGTHMEVRGGGNVELKAPKTGDLAGFVIVDRKYSWDTVIETEIQGGGRLKIEGIVYVPHWKVNISGNGDMNQEAKYVAMIADSFYMEGNGRLYVNADAKAADLPDLMPRIKNGPRLLY